VSNPEVQPRAILADFLAIPEERRFHELIAGELPVAGLFGDDQP